MSFPLIYVFVNLTANPFTALISESFETKYACTRRTVHNISFEEFDVNIEISK